MMNLVSSYEAVSDPRHAEYNYNVGGKWILVNDAPLYWTNNDPFYNYAIIQPQDYPSFSIPTLNCAAGQSPFFNFSTGQWQCMTTNTIPIGTGGTTPGGGTGTPGSVGSGSGTQNLLNDIMKWLTVGPTQKGRIISSVPNWTVVSGLGVLIMYMKNRG